MLREDWLPLRYEPGEEDCELILEDGRPYPGWCDLGKHDAPRTWVMASSLPIRHACRSCLRDLILRATWANGGPPSAFFETT